MPSHPTLISAWRRSRLGAAATSPYILLALTALFWAGNTIIGRAMDGSIPPVALAFWRWTLALVVLAPWAGPRLVASLPILARHWPIVLALSVLSVTVFNTLLYVALTTTAAINAAVIASVQPVVVPALGWLLFRTPLPLGQGIAFALALAGVLVMIARGDVHMLAGLSFNGGDLLVLVAVVDWSLYTVLLRRLPVGLDPVAFLGASFASGLVVLAPIYALEIAGGAVMTLTGPGLLAISYIAVFPSLLAYLFWNRSVAAVGANAAAMFLYLVPVFVAVLAIAFLDEGIAPYHLIGIGLIFAGIHVATRRRGGADGGVDGRP